MSYRLIRFGAVTLPDLDADDDQRVVTRQDAVIVTPDGWYDAAGSERNKRQPTDIVARRVVAEDTTVAARTVLNALRALVGQRAQLVRRWQDNTDEWCTARLMDLGGTAGAHDIVHTPLDLTFRVISASWYGLYHGAPWVLDAGIFLDTWYVLDSVITYAITDPLTTPTITNGGNAVVSNAVLTLTAGDVKISSVYFIHNVTNQQMVYSADIVAGKSLVIDCGAQTVKNNAVAAYANFVVNHNRWLDLLPGTNGLSVLITGGGTGATLSVSFYDGWE
jgi:hypothetical protein